MAAITGTKAVGTEFAGYYKIVGLTATVGSASDTITISQASHGIDAVDHIVGYAITAGADAAFTNIQVAKTNATTLTITSFEQDGTPATDFTGTTIAVTVIGH